MMGVYPAPTVSYNIQMKFLFSMIVVLILGWQAQAQAMQCQTRDVEMRFKPAVSKVKFNTNQSVQDLTNLHSDNKARGAVTGLTSASIFYEYEALFKITQTDAGFCVAIDKMKMLYRAEPIVYISSELERGSCEFKAVLKHENKHVRALKRVHAQHAQAFKKDVENALERIQAKGPIPENGINAAKEKMQDDLDYFLDEKLLPIVQAAAKAHNRIDSPSEYETVSTACLNEGQRFRSR